jgi:hypothetical protein
MNVMVGRRRLAQLPASPPDAQEPLISGFFLALRPNKLGLIYKKPPNS